MTSIDQDAARLLWEHWQAGSVLDGLPATMRPASRAAGYAIQACLPVVSGRGVVGWKIAATSTAGQAHIGVDAPLAGRVLAGRVAAPGARLSLAGNRMRVTETEFAFRLGRDLAPRAEAYSVDEVLAAVDALLLALEVPDSRYREFATVGAPQLLADAACGNLFVIGEPVAIDWRRIDLGQHRVHGRVLDAGGACRIDREGIGSNVLGDPRVALAWLVNELSGLGVTVQAGQFVSTGTCMVPLEVLPGDEVHADYGELGRISVSFAPD